MARTLWIMSSLCSVLAGAACGFDKEAVPADGSTADVVQPAPVMRVEVSPDPLDFGRVLAGTSAQRQLTVSNRGDVLVQLTSVMPVDSSGEFMLASDPGARLPYRLPPGESFVVELAYSPTSDGRDDAALVVAYQSAPDLELWEEQVALLGNAGVPCLSVNRDADFNFGDTLVDESATRSLTLTNCSRGEGAVNLDLTSLGLVDGDGEPSSPAFTLVGAPALPALLVPGAELTVDVVFTPTVLEQQERAWLEVTSNDEFHGPMLYELSGRGSTNACPQPRVSCSVRGRSGLPSDELGVDLLEMVECTSEGTSDPDGDTIVEYDWRLQRPDSSASVLDAVDQPDTRFSADTIGTYVVSLDVRDERGRGGCQSATATIIAQPGEEIAVELFWTTPADDDETNEGIGRGTDMDLHFLHRAKGCWNSIPWDCHWRNKSPDWGLPGNMTDNPGIDIDDTDGAGPEGASLNSPEDAVYGVGVEYYDNHGFGSSVATVRIYLLGELVFERTRELTESKQFWEVADIDWATQTVESLDVLHPAIEAALCE